MTNTIKTPNTKTPIMENPITKNLGYIVTTKKIKLEGLRPTEEFWYSVEITDGKTKASFINRGESFLKYEDFASGTNKLNSKFWMSKNDKKLHYMESWGVNKGVKQQKEALKQFIESCLTIPVRFSNAENVLVSTITYRA